MRRAFESECGFAPLSENERDRSKQALLGHVQSYQDNFLLWATKRLGLEVEAPAAIQKKISTAE